MTINYNILLTLLLLCCTLSCGNNKEKNKQISLNNASELIEEKPDSSTITLNEPAETIGREHNSSKTITELVSELIEKDLPFYTSVDTPDYMYIDEFSEQFLLHKSPMSFFDNHEDIYDSFEGVHKTDFFFIGPGFSKWIPYYSYWMQWVLVDSMLYLSDICFLDEPPMGDYKYKVMEDFTGEVFSKNPAIEERLPVDRIRKEGLIMPAIWANDTFLVKRKRRDWHEQSDEWQEKEPVRELVFENGKLVDMKIRSDIR